MPDTDRYRQWAAMLSASDAVLVQLAGLSLVALIVWARLGTLPEPWRGAARTVYMAGALGYLLVQIVTTRGTLLVLLSVLAVSVVARAVWANRRRVAIIRPVAQTEEQQHASN